MWFWMSRPSRRQPLSGSDAFRELIAQTESPGLVPDLWYEAGVCLGFQTAGVGESDGKVFGN